MQKEHHLLREIEADQTNLQSMLDCLKLSESKGEYRRIASIMKETVKEIHNTKCLVEVRLFDSQETVRLPLFEVEPSPVTGLAQYKEMDSFFGGL